MIKKIKKLVGPLAISTASLLFPFAVMAEEIVPEKLPKAEIIPIVRAIINFILVVAFVLAFIMLLVGGIRWILAGGDEKAVAGARNTITAALIGLVIVLVAYAIIKLVETFFGVSIITGGVTIPTVGQ